MQLVPEEVGAGGAAVPIIHCKEGASGPVLDLFEFRFDNIENDGHPVLIVVPDNALVRVGRVAADHSVLFAGEFGRMVRLHESFDLLLLHFHVLLLLLDCHDEATVSSQLVLALRLLHA